MCTIVYDQLSLQSIVFYGIDAVRDALLYFLAVYYTLFQISKFIDITCVTSYNVFGDIR